MREKMAIILYIFFFMISSRLCLEILIENVSNCQFCDINNAFSYIESSIESDFTINFLENDSQINYQTDLKYIFFYKNIILIGNSKISLIVNKELTLEKTKLKIIGLELNLIAEKSSLILYNSTLELNNIKSTSVKGVNVLTLFQNSLISLKSSNLNLNELRSNFVFSSNQSIILIDDIVIQNNNFIDFCFIFSDYIVLIKTLILKDCSFSKNSFFLLHYSDSKSIINLENLNFININGIIEENQLIYVINKNNEFIFIIKNSFFSKINCKNLIYFIGNLDYNSNSIEIRNITVRNSNYANFLIAENLFLIDIDYFFCLENNKNDLLIKGSCLYLNDILIIQVNNTKIIDNKGNLDIPGLIFQSTNYKLEKILINSTIFSKNKMIISKLVPNSKGVSIYSEKVKQFEIYNTDFTLNEAYYEQTPLFGEVAMIVKGSNLIIIKKCVFLDNRSYTSYILMILESLTIIIDNCIIRNNTQWTKTFAQFSRVISAAYYNFSFTNNLCIDNYYGAGMIFLTVIKESSILNVVNCLFHGNIFKGNGQFTLDESLNRSMLIKDSTISNCAGAQYSATLYVYIYNQVIFQNITFENVILLNNTANSAVLLVVWIYSPHVHINNFKLLSYYNRAVNFGGAPINIFGIDKNFFYTVKDSYFIKTLSIQSGIFYLYALTFKMYNTYFIDNFANLTASCFDFVSLVDGTLDNITLINSITNINAAIALITDSCKFILKNSVISGGQSQVEMILVQGFSLIEFHNVRIYNFTKNNSKGLRMFSIRNTGALKNIFNNVIFDNIDLLDAFYMENTICYFYNNKINNFNQSFFTLRNCRIELIDCVFYGIYSKGIIFDFRGSDFLINNCVFSHISSEKDKFFKAEDSILKFELVQFLEIKSNLQIFYLSFCDLYLQNIILNNFKGSFIYSQKSDLFMNYISAELKNYKSSYSFISSSNSLKFVLENSNFTNFISSESGGLIWISKYDEIDISLNNFTKITSEKLGGVIFLEYCNATIKNNFFSNNTGLRGGGISLLTIIYNKIEIENNIFQYNNAILNGGAIFIEQIPPLINNNNFIKNKAKYGENFSTYPNKLGIKVYDSSKKLIFENYESDKLIFLSEKYSGFKIEETFLLEILDYYDQKVKEDTAFEVTLTLYSNCSLCDEKYKTFLPENFNQFSRNYSGTINSLEGVTSLFFDSNYSFIFTDLYLTATPITTVYMVFTSSSIKISSKSDLKKDHPNNFFQKNLALVIPIIVPHCFLGSIYLSKSNICSKCLQNTYSLDTNDTYCRPCPSYAYCYGGFNVSVLKGYWRRDFESTIYLCDRSMDNCLGGYFSNCSEFSSGELCNDCVAGYQKSFSGECQPCPNAILIFFVYSGLFLLFFGGLLYLSNYFINSQFNSYKKLITKQLINYFQILIIFQAYNLNLHQFILKVFYMTNNLSQIGSFWFSFECSFNEFKPPTFIKGIIVLIIILLILTGIWGYSFLQKIERENKIKEFFIRIQIFYYILHPTFLDSFYANIVCRNIDDEMVLEQDSNINCNDSKYVFWLVFFYGPFLIIWVCIIPYFIFKINLKQPMLQSIAIANKSKITPLGNKVQKIIQTKKVMIGENSTNLEKHEIVEILNEKLTIKNEKEYNFFTYGYINSPYIHEIFNFFTKTLLIFLNRSNYQNDIKLLTILLIMIYNICFCGWKPLYKMKINNDIDFHYKFIMIVTGYFLIWVISNKNVEDDYSFKVFFYIAVLFNNIWFIFRISWIFGLRKIAIKIIEKKLFIYKKEEETVLKL